MRRIRCSRTSSRSSSCAWRDERRRRGCPPLGGRRGARPGRPPGGSSATETPSARHRGKISTSSSPGRDAELSPAHRLRHPRAAPTGSSRSAGSRPCSRSAYHPRRACPPRSCTSWGEFLAIALPGALVPRRALARAPPAAPSAVAADRHPARAALAVGARRMKRALIAVGFALFYAYDVWEAVSTLIELPKFYEAHRAHDSRGAVVAADRRDRPAAGHRSCSPWCSVASAASRSSPSSCSSGSPWSPRSRWVRSRSSTALRPPMFSL